MICNLKYNLIEYLILQTSMQSSRSKKNKSRNLDASSIITTVQPIDGNSFRVDSKLCEAALKALTAIITSAGCMMKAEHHKVNNQHKISIS